MTVSYEKLWRLVKRNKMTKGQLAVAAGVSDYSMTKLSKGETVQMEVMMRICKVFHCDIGDVMEIIEDEIK